MPGDQRWGSRRRRSVLSVVAVALVLGVSACDQGEPTEPETTPSESVEVTTDPTEEPTTEASTDAPTPPDQDQPTLPAEAAVDDRAGAAAFAEYFFALMEYAYATGDTRLLEQKVSTECAYCSTRLEALEAMVSDGGWIDGPSSTLTDIRVQFPESGSSTYTVRFVLDIPEQTAHRGDGTTQTIDEQHFPTAALGATWTSSGFITSAVNLETDG